MNQAGLPGSETTSAAPNPIEPIEVKITSSAGEQLGKIDVGPGITCSSVRDAHDANNSCRSIDANFLPATGSLADATGSAEGDHFNWLQVVVAEDDGATVDHQGKWLDIPYPDPPCGGYGDGSGIAARWADDLPWYLSETAQPGTHGPTALQEATSANRLNMNDTPTNTPGTHNSFKTWLVLVDRTGRPVEIFQGFQWTVTMDHARVGQLTELTPITHPPTGPEFAQILKNGGCQWKR